MADSWIFHIELIKQNADDPSCYCGTKWDDNGNVIGEDTAEERAAWFDRFKGKVLYRLICTNRANKTTGEPSMADKRILIEGPIDDLATQSEGIVKIFEALGESIAIQITQNKL